MLAGGPGALITGQGSVQVIQSYWFVKSETLGKVSIGLQSQASDNTAILVDGSGSLVAANWVAFDTRGFFIRNTDGTLSGHQWGVDVGGCAGMGGAWGDCNGLTQNAVRYDSPTFGGFSVSASWGADDFWDIAARYAGEFSGIKVAAAAAYNEVSDANYNNLRNNGLVPGGLNNMNYFQVGAYAQHIATGLFGLVNYGTLDVDGALENTDTWYLKGGIRTRFTPLGATILYAEYLNNQDSAIVGDELEVWGLGAVQEIDAAAMSVWLKYRNLSYDDNMIGTDFEDFNYVGVGGLINF